MKLTLQDMVYLQRNNNSAKDIAQMQRAIRKTKYVLHNKKENTDTPLTQKEVIKLLGREEFLSGIERSTFHCTSVREVNDNEFVYFDSSNYFK